MAGQNKSSMRKKLRSALAHKKLADKLLDSMVDMQTKWNSAMLKLEADSPAALDTDYVATQAITDIFESDNPGTGAQHKATFRKSLRSALMHKKLANEICDALEELHVAHNALMAKLDAEAGTLDDTDYASLLSLSVLSPDAEGTGAQHKASFRRTLEVSLANRPLADAMLDSLVEMQSKFNAQLALLDTSAVTGSNGNQVSVLTPDA